MIEIALALTMSAASELEPGAVVSLPPHVGVLLSTTEKVGVALFLPWVWRIPAEEGSVFRPNQLVIEPGVLFRGETLFTVRGAVRWLRSVVPWLALGGGIGMGAEIGSNTRALSSLELISRLGIGPNGFGQITARAELRMDGSVGWLLALGGTYW